MLAGKYSFIIQEGATFDLQIKWTDSNNTPIDLENYHARMQIRPNVDSDIIILELSSSLSADGSGILLNGINGDMPYSSGSIGIHIAASTTETLKFTEATYDLEMVQEAVVVRLLEGKTRISKNVTR
jgi:hypothetical protein